MAEYLQETDARQDAGAEKSSAEQSRSDEKQGGEQPPAEASTGDAGQLRGEDEGQAAQRPRSGEEKSGQDREAMGELRARSLLNRLQDQPGKALMPRYQKRRIEKDW